MERSRASEAVDREERRIADAIAGRVIELVRDELGSRDAREEWIDAKEVARRFSLSRAWVYAHAAQLGAVRLGDGVKPRLRFDARVVAEALRAEATPPREPEPPASAPAGMPIHVPRVRPRRSS